MSSPSSSTLPVIQPPSESSCMRFRQRRNVVLPHPDGPINAVTVCRGNMSDTSFTTARRPYRAVSRAVSSWSRASAGGAMTLPNRPAGGEGEEQHESHQHERRRPGETVPLVERPGGVHRSEEHTSELQSLAYLVCRLLLEKKKMTIPTHRR